MKKIIIIIILIIIPLFMMGDKLGTLTQVLKPAYLEMDETEIVICEGSVFYVFSTKDLSFIRKFGNKGSGPGELADVGFIANPVTIIKDGYFVEGVHKFIFFDKKGKLVKEKRKTGNLTQTMPIGENFVALKVGPPNEANNNKAMLELCFFDKDLNFKKVLTKTIFSSQGQPPKLNMVPESINFSIYDEKIFIEESHQGFIISVFDNKGEKLYQIKKNYNPIKITAGHKERILEDFKNDSLVTAQIKGAGGWNNFRKLIVMNYPETYPPLQELNIANGKLYVTTYEEKDELEKMMVMDLKGKVLRETFIIKTPKSSFLARLIGKKARLYKILNDTIYYLYENADDEEWEIHTYKIK